jgi:hypothetical protein
VRLDLETLLRGMAAEEPESAAGTQRVVRRNVADIMFVSLLRYRNVGPLATRVTTAVAFPDALDFDDVFGDGDTAFEPIGGGETRDDPHLLCGMMRFFGTMEGGHYVSVVHRLDGWWLMDDGKIRRLKDVHGEGENRSATVLIYVRRSRLGELWRDGEVEPEEAAGEELAGEEATGEEAAPEEAAGEEEELAGEEEVADEEVSSEWDF